MLIKKAFSDGLLQIAIVLSLLRTDWYNYLNSIHDYHSYPEIQDIILGPLSGITQTDFHNQGAWQPSLFGGYAHHKNIDSYYSNAALRDLHELTQYPHFAGVPTNVDAWLINDPSSVKLPSENADTNNNNQEQPVSNNDGSAESIEGTPTGAVNLNFNSLVNAAHLPVSELTKEDMDLIDVLWRQDIDLGVGREMFDLSLRKELEQERELELHKQQEEELLDLEKNPNLPPPSADTSYVLDCETGEMVIAPLAQKNVNTQPTGLEPNEGLSMEDSVLLLQETAELNIVANADDSSLTPSSIQEDTFSQELDNFMESSPHIPDAVSMGLAEFGRQNSFEQRWSDVTSLLSLDNNTAAASSTSFFTTQPETIVNQSASQYPTNALVQNATLPLTMNHVDMPSQSSVFGHQESFPAQNATADNLIEDFSGSTLRSLLSPTNASNLINSSEIFPNLTQPVTDAETNVLLDSSLMELLDAAEEMNDINITNLETYLPAYGAHSRTNSTSSDSAISMTESITMQHDTNESGSYMSSGSPFDGLEGATGGSEDGDSQKSSIGNQSGYDSAEYAMADYSFHTSNIQTNHTYNSNISSHPSPSPKSISRQAAHNHTYPLQPGQSPREPSTSSSSSNNSTSVGAVTQGKRASDKPAHVTREMRKLKEAKLPFTVQDITETSVEAFTDMLQRYTLTERQLQLVRDIRRRGKNKVAAQNCRKRKMEVIQSLEDEVAGMKAQRDELVRQRRSLQREMSQMKGKFGGLYDEVFNSLRDEEGNPYDPEKYVLKHSDDGHVFLVPKSDSPAKAEKEHKTKGSRKRKSHKSDV